MAPTDVKIAQLPAPSESLWHFLSALPATAEAQILYALLLSGVVGMMSHYFTRWAKGEIAGSLFAYLFASSVRHTALAFIVMMSSAITAITSGVFTTESGAFVGWLNVMWFGITNGYAADSIANKSDPQQPKSTQGV